MKYTAQQRLTREVVAEIIANGWDLEASRDLDGVQLNFAPLWPDITLDPDFSMLELEDQAVLSRLTGFFLSYFGAAKSLRNYQERAKNLLTRSIGLFSQLNDKIGRADAESVLALCYINEGGLREGEDILEESALNLNGHHLHPVYLRNRNNLITAKAKQNRFQECLQIIDEIAVPIEFCDDLKTCAIYHEKAGIIFRKIKQYDRAVWHYEESIRFAARLGNLLFISTEHNNLAFLYNETRNFEKAHHHINESLSLAIENDFAGWLPIYRDTQALIFANEGRLDKALEAIDEAIVELRKGEDYYTLTDSMWNKCKFLLQLDRKEEAIELFSEMIPIAARQMGEFAVKNFSKEFAEMIYVRSGSDLTEEVRKFKKTEILNALRQSKFSIDDAADVLKITATALSKILDREFPELNAELDLHLKPTASGNFPGIEKTKPESVPKDISELKLKNVTIELEGDAVSDFRYFYVSAKFLSGDQFPSRDAVFAVESAERVAANEFVVVFDEIRRTLHFGQAGYDVDLNLYFIAESADKTPLFLNDLKLIGRVRGYLPFEDLSADRLNFRRF
jgi:tetratricopeptide (TPR) repeat protein